MCVEKTPWEQVIDFHGHTCPGIAIGYRVAQIAVRELGIRPTPKSELTATAFTRSCAVDAFQIINHTTYGRGNLHVEEKSQHIYQFQYTETTECIQISVQPEMLENLKGIRNIQNAREKQNKTLEAIQLILGAEENQFCSIERIQV